MQRRAYLDLLLLVLLIVFFTLATIRWVVFLFLVVAIAYYLLWLVLRPRALPHRQLA